MRLNLFAGLTAPVMLCAAAFGDTVNVRFVETGMTRSVNITGSVFAGTVQAGELIHQFSGGTGQAAWLQGNIPTFCTELTQHVNTSWRTFTLARLQDAPVPGEGMGLMKANAIADISSAAAGMEHSSQNWAAVFQMVLWEIVYDYNGAPSSVDFSTGSVRFNSGSSWFGASSGIFTTLRNAIGARGGLNGNQALRAVSNSTTQDQVVYVPLPSASLAGGVTLLSLTLVRRRRRA